MTAPALSLPRRLCMKASRDATGLHVIEGVPPFLHAVEAGIELTAIFHSRVLLRSARAQKYVRLQKRAGVSTKHLTPEAIREVSRTSRASGVLAIARQRWHCLSSISLDGSPTVFVLVLEHVRSAGNLGTILRTAEAVGFAAVVILSPRCDPYEIAAVRASMGAVFDVPLGEVRPTNCDSGHSAAGWPAPL